MKIICLKSYAGWSQKRQKAVSVSQSDDDDDDNDDDNKHICKAP